MLHGDHTCEPRRSRGAVDAIEAVCAIVSLQGVCCKESLELRTSTTQNGQKQQEQVQESGADAHRGELVDLRYDGAQGCLVLCLLCLEIHNLGSEVGISSLQGGQLSLEDGIVGANFCLAGWQDGIKAADRCICDAPKQARVMITPTYHHALRQD